MQSDRGLTRRQALAASAAAAGAAALGAPRAAQARDHDHDRGDGHGPRRESTAADADRSAAAGPRARARSPTVPRSSSNTASCNAPAAANGRPRRAPDRRRRGVRAPGPDRRAHARGDGGRRQAGAGRRRDHDPLGARRASTQDVGLRALGEYGGLGLPRMLAAGLFVTPNLGDSLLADPRLAPLAALPERRARARTGMGPSSCEVNIARGVDHIKTRSTERAGLPAQDPRVQVYDERQIRAVVNAARKLRGGVMCHGHGDEGIRDSVRAGVRSVEHGTFASAATLERDARPRDVPRPDAVGGRRHRRDRAGSTRTPCSSSAGEDDARDAALRPSRRRYARGIPIVAGTDTSYTAASLSSVAGEVRLLGEFGLSNLDALRVGDHDRRDTRRARARARPAEGPATPPTRFVSRREPALRPRRARERPAGRRRRLGRTRGGVGRVGARERRGIAAEPATTVHSPCGAGGAARLSV